MLIICYHSYFMLSQVISRIFQKRLHPREETCLCAFKVDSSYCSQTCTSAVLSAPWSNRPNTETFQWDPPAWSWVREDSFISTKCQPFWGEDLLTLFHFLYLWEKRYVDANKFPGNLKLEESALQRIINHSCNSDELYMKFSVMLKSMLSYRKLQ